MIIKEKLDPLIYQPHRLPQKKYRQKAVGDFALSEFYSC